MTRKKSYDLGELLDLVYDQIGEALSNPDTPFANRVQIWRTVGSLKGTAYKPPASPRRKKQMEDLLKEVRGA